MVDYITYKEKKYPVKVGYTALKNFQNHGKDGKKLSMMDLQEDYSLYEPLLFYALQKGAKIEGEKLEFKITDMEDILEDVLFSQFVEIVTNSFEDEASKITGAGGKTKK